MRTPILKTILVAGAALALAGLLAGPNLGMAGVGTLWAVAAAFSLFLAADARAARARHDEIAATGVPALVTIRRAQSTGLRVNDVPQLALSLHVQPEDGSPAFECEQRLLVPFEGLGALHSGRPLHARVARDDRSRLAIDWGTAVAA